MKTSPFDGSLLAVAAACNFGLKGAGRLYILRLPTGPLATAALLHQIDFRDGLFDCAWSETDPGLLVAGGGDGCIYRIRIKSSDSPPAVETLWQHSREVSSIDWSPLRLDKFLSTSWDGTIRIGCGGRADAGVALSRHSAVVNEARWSPRHANAILSVSADRTIRTWDDRQPPAAGASIVIAPLDGVSDVLTCDWNKYEEWTIATASPSDIFTWDLRAVARGPLLRIPGAHRRAIKRLRWSPWSPAHLVSVGFDMTVRFWDAASLNPRGSVFDGYTEFALGLDWSVFERGRFFSCSWDETVRAHMAHVALGTL